MRLLATEFWEKNNCKDKDLCRIQWVFDQCVEYFYSTGQENASVKEEKMYKQYFGTNLEPKKIIPETVLKLLDVGSCYNPFAKFPIFKVTAVDLMPATEDVVKCDFLSVATSDEVTSVENPSSVLPQGYYDVVVFSLLLEYFPSSKQRFKCCEKAFEVLKTSGLLFILTPDSKHATANSKVMKSWRLSLSSLGFWRVNYQKLKHLHCMAYRKCSNSEVTRCWLSKQNCDAQPEDLFYIPQDFNEYCGKSDQETSHERSKDDNEVLANNFTSLPDFDIFT